jgi:hypothetical protein
VEFVLSGISTFFQRTCYINRCCHSFLKRAPSGVPIGKYSSESDPAKDGAMQLALDVQSAFLGMSLSSTAGFLPHCALKFRCTKTTTFASQLEAHLQTVTVEQLPGNHNTTEQSAYQVADYYYNYYYYVLFVPYVTTCNYTVLCLQLALWLLAQHINNKELN